MARPTVRQQLETALAAGDIEKAKTLIAKLDQPTKIKIEKKTVEPNSDFIATARSQNKQEKYTRDDGTDGVRSKTVPFNTTKHKNTWKDEEGVNQADVEFDKAVHKNGVKRGPNRQKAKQRKVICSRCNEPTLLWPSEIIRNDIENWVCDTCLKANRRKYGD